MAFNTLMAKAVAFVRSKITVMPASVIELGNQRYKVKDDVTKHILKQYKEDSSYIPNSVKDFYISLGFNKYVAIDVNTDKDAIAMDLNVDIQKEYGYGETYNLVTNNGTSEHIFNQHTIFLNMHNLCKVDGYMIHCLPFHGWIDHGFYNFNPNLFLCVAEQNDYNIIDIWFGSSKGDKVVKVDLNDYYKQDIRKKYDLDNLHQDILIVVVLQKTKNNKFTIPMQSRYVQDIKSAEINERYK